MKNIIFKLGAIAHEVKIFRYTLMKGEETAVAYLNHSTVDLTAKAGHCGRKLTLAVGFYPFYRSLHHTPLLDIDFESLLSSTVSNQSI